MFVECLLPFYMSLNFKHTILEETAQITRHCAANKFVLCFLRTVPTNGK